MAACTCADPTLVAQSIDKVTSEIATQTDLVTEQMLEDTEEINETLYGKALDGGTGGPGAFGPIRFCRWRAPEVSDVGENAWATAAKAAMTAIALANSVAQGQIAEKQQDLAESWFSHANYKWNRFNDNYRPLEETLLNEVRSEPIRELDCDGAENRADMAVDTAYASMNAYITRKARSMRLLVDPSLLNIVGIRQMALKADTVNFNISDDQWFTDYKNDKRWNRRSNMLNLGRNLSSESLKYGDVARQTYGRVGQQLDRAAQGVVQALGYYGSRNDTYIPSTFLQASSGPLVSTNPGSEMPSTVAYDPFGTDK